MFKLKDTCYLTEVELLALKEEDKMKEPLLVFTARISRCAGGYHIKIRPKDVKRLNLDGKSVKIKMYDIEPSTLVMSEEPPIERDEEVEKAIRETKKLKDLEALLAD